MSLSSFSRLLLLSGLACGGAIVAQGPPQPVTWSVSETVKSLKPGGQTTLDISADLQEGWHVYAFNQVAGGPTPLRIVVDDNDIVQAAGAPTGTAPTKKHDTSFDLETESYTHSFNLRVPVETKLHAAPGKQEVALSVRFQACNDRTCLPPRTVHLKVPIEILAETK